MMVLGVNGISKLHSWGRDLRRPYDIKNLMGDHIELWPEVLYLKSSSPLIGLPYSPCRIPSQGVQRCSCHLWSLLAPVRVRHLLRMCFGCIWTASLFHQPRKQGAQIIIRDTLAEAQDLSTLDVTSWHCWSGSSSNPPRVWGPTHELPSRLWVVGPY